MEKCKTKVIQADLGIFMHLLAYSDIFKHKRAYSAIQELLGHIQACSESPVTLTYLES